MMIRPARQKDTKVLAAFENAVFETNQLSQRSFRELIAKRSAEALVAVDECGNIMGYSLVLYRKGSRSCRLYSLATHPGFRNRGVAKTLLAASEQTAVIRNCLSMRLEVRKDNLPAQRLYQKLGYVEFGMIPGYYQDHMDGLRFVKKLVP